MSRLKQYLGLAMTYGAMTGEGITKSNSIRIETDCMSKGHHTYKEIGRNKASRQVQCMYCGFTTTVKNK